MSSPPSDLPARRPEPIRPSVRQEIGARIARAALQVAWSARNPREPLARHPEESASERLWYRAEDGWESPLWRLPTLPDGRGEPVALFHAMGTNRHSFDFGPELSLARRLHAAGLEVYLVGVRGDREGIPPAGAAGYDFDDIVEQDVPAALARIRELSGCPRVLWVGHALGAQLLVAHLARGGAPDVAAAVSLCAAVRFRRPQSHARLIQAAAHLLPTDLPVPLRVLHAALAPTAGAQAWANLSQDTEGPTARGMMLHGVEDLRSGLLRQVARWLDSGTLCDRTDRLDYLEAARGCRVPLLVVSAGGDEICPPESAYPLVEAWDAARVKWLALGSDWGHLDPLVGRAAPELLHPEILGWLERWRGGCLEVDPG